MPSRTNWIFTGTGHGMEGGLGTCPTLQWTGGEADIYLGLVHFEGPTGQLDRDVLQAWRWLISHVILTGPGCV
jgi:hypothetical protein